MMKMLCLRHYLIVLLSCALVACNEDTKKTKKAENEECCESSKISIVIEKLNIEVPPNVLKNAKIETSKDEALERVSKDGHSSPMATSAAEEGRSSKYCSEIDNSTLKITSRSEWKSSKVSTSEKRTRKADLVIVEGNSNKREGLYEPRWMRQKEEFEFLYFGDYLSNFYIGDDGTVLEGLGWDHWNSLANGGLGERSIIVYFFSLVEDRPPSEASLRSYDELLKAAICRNMLTPDYNLISKYLVWDYGPIERREFEKSVMNTWDRYTDNLDFLFGNDNVDHGVFPIAMREEWSEEILPQNMFTITPPIQYVVISNLGSRCFNYHGCIQEVKSLNKFLKMQNLLFLPNFVIGEDGRAYEVIGWDNANTGELGREKAILVLFAGEFNDYHPHSRALTTFNRLMKLGIWMGKVSKDYNVAFASGDDLPTGDGLRRVYEGLRRMVPYAFKF